MRKKVLCLALAFLLVLTCLPVTAVQATETEETAAAVETAAVQALEETEAPAAEEETEPAVTEADPTAAEETSEVPSTEETVPPTEETAPTELPETAPTEEPGTEPAQETEAAEEPTVPETAAVTLPETAGEEALLSAETEISQEDFEAGLAAAGTNWYYLEKTLTLTSDLTIGNRNSVYIRSTGAIVIPEGKTLTLKAALDNVYGAIRVEKGGTLLLENGDCSVQSGGSLTVAEGGTLRLNDEKTIFVRGGALTLEDGAVLDVDDGGTCVYDEFNGSVISGVPSDRIRGSATPVSADALREVLRAGKDYKSLSISLKSGMTLDGELEIPANARVDIYNNSNLEIKIPAGAVLTNNGSIEVRGESTLYLEEGCTFQNQGKLTIEAPAVLIGAEYLTGEPPIYDGYTTQEQFEKAYGVSLGKYELKDCFTLSADLTLDGADITVYYGAILTVPSGKTLTVDVPMRLSGKIVVEDGGSLVVTDGTQITVDGKLTVAPGASVKAGSGSIYCADWNSPDRGEISGVPGAYLCVDALAFDFDDLQTLLAECVEFASCEIWASGITMGNDVTIPKNVTLVAGNRTLTIPAGTTLTNYGSISVEEQNALVIEDGGILNNQGTVTADFEGCIVGSVAGNQVVVKTAEEKPDDGSTTMTQAEFEKAVLTDESYDGFVLTKTVTYTTDSALSVGATIGAGGSVIIPEGVTLQLAGGFYIQEGGSLTVKKGGAIRILGDSTVFSGTITVKGGTFTVEEGGTLTMQLPKVYFYSDNGGSIQGVPGRFIQGESTVSNCEALEAMVKTGADYAVNKLILEGDIVIDGDLTIPENTRILWHSEKSKSMTIQKGTTLTNLGYMRLDKCTVPQGAALVNSGTVDIIDTLQIETGGTVQNPGRIILDMAATVTGEIQGNAPLSSSESQKADKITTYAQLKEALASTKDWNDINVEGDIVLEEDTLILENRYLYLKSNGSITVPAGITLTNEGALFISGTVTIASGGSLVNQGYITMGLDGVLQAQDGSHYRAEYGSRLYGDMESITGIPKSEIYLYADAATEEELRTVISDSGYVGKTIWLENMTITEDMTIPADCAVVMNDLDGGTLQVSSGVTLTLEGGLHYASVQVRSGGTFRIRNGGYFEVNSDTDLVIEDGGKLEAEPGGIHLETSSGCTALSSVSSELVYAYCYINNLAELKSLIAVSSHYYHVDVTLRGGTLAITEDLTIPENMTIVVADWNGATGLVVLDGVNLTNEGTILVKENSSLLVQQGGKLTSTGKVETENGGTVIITGEESAQALPIYRLYNPYTLEHLLTASETEMENLVAVGWSLDGIAWNAPADGTPVYRLYNPYDDFHFYTMSMDEVDSLTPLGWTLDGVVCSSAPEDGKPIFRLFNPYEQTCYHMYTTSTQERDYLASLGWIAEGVAWYSAE